MGLRRESIEQRLKEMDGIVQELDKYRDVNLDSLRADTSLSWVIERGLISGASTIFDIADRILAGHFGFYAQTYEDSLKALFDKNVISGNLYDQIKGLGGLRNILVHRYAPLDPGMILDSFHKSLIVFPLFAREIIGWLDTV